MNNRSSQTPPMIDEAFFNTIYISMGPQRFLNTIELYRNHWGGRLVGARNKPIEEIIAVVHGLVGASRNLGLQKVASDAASFEDALREYKLDDQDIAARQNQLEESFLATLEAVTNMLEQGDSADTNK